MRYYLSSFHLCSDPSKLTNLVSENKKCAVIVNALDDVVDASEKQKIIECEINDMNSLGFETEHIDLRNYFGQKEELKEKMKSFGLVWVRGGNVFVLRRAYKLSGFDEIVLELSKREDFVYSGFSAGVCVLSPSLKGYEIVDNPNIVPEGYEPEIIWDGLGLIDFVFLPHFESDHPESHLIGSEVEYCIKNNIAYKTLHDGESIVLE